MQTTVIEKFLSRLLAITGAVVTLLLVSGSVTDPVNTPKMVALGVFSSAAIAAVAASQLRSSLAKHKFVILIVALFVFFMTISSAMSKAPSAQILYGSYGRNTGFLTYLFLCFTLVVAVCLNSLISFRSIVNGLIFAGVVNLLYGLWVILFGDFIGWENPYKSILGTFGNPNFVGAFLGIIFATLLAIAFDSSSSTKFRIFGIAMLPICAYEILNTNAIQGRVVAALGSAIVVFYYLRSRFNKIVIIGFTIIASVCGGFALAGALQVGPLAQYIYKTSVSLRGQYWLAGWNTGESHPFTGVGMDSFGDWYRRMRDERALELPGVNTVVNAAHNVPLDIFAFGGWPLFISYLLIMGCGVYSIIRVTKRQKKFDFTFVVLVSSWTGYQLQSIISINQIGLAIWGWVLTGTLIAYERLTRISEHEIEAGIQPVTRIKKEGSKFLPPQIPLFAILGGIVGLIIALPPLSADIKWRSAILSRTLPALEESMNVSYFNPPNSMKYMQNIQTLEQSNLLDLSHKYALEATKWNPNSFDIWKALYLIKNSTDYEKTIAIQNMKRLDPLNPDVTKP
jgi:hypothetical protein